MLTPEHFADFVREVHGGRDPFPWQQALLARVLEQGWPETIDVPTGLGKTSVIDVAVFLAGLHAESSRRRIFFVVDRRLVVDEAQAHAQTIAHALADPGTDKPVVAMVAAALRQIGDDGPPLDVTRMRGGVTWDRVWLDRPDRFAVVTGTVDQIGSRLLFRGYGVNENARSLDAALVGTDSLIVIDEAHLASALVSTLTDAFALDIAAEDTVARPVVVTMSATSNDATGNVLRIDHRDEAHEIAGRRLRAEKSMGLVQVNTAKPKADRDVAEAIANLAVKLASDRVVGVVVNTVSRARAVFETIRAEGIDSVLLTGRSRQVDRQHLLAEYYPRIGLSRNRTAQDSFIAVATQTIEVGANVDFDAMITESAPLSSLVQRLGRLNRIAECGRVPAPAIVVHDSTVELADPVYGSARLATWEWLSTIISPVQYSAKLDPLEIPETIDASPLALRTNAAKLSDDQALTMRAAEPYVPVLWRSTLDTWARTSPAPEPDQPVAPYLHGIVDLRRSVTVVWRAGIDPKLSKDWTAVVDATPPVADEGLEIDLFTARRWLNGLDADRTESDLEAAPEPPDSSKPRRTAARISVDKYDPVKHASRPALRQVGTASGYRRPRGTGWEMVGPEDIRPGDTIVVPLEYGGCDRFGWCPDSTDPVLDIGDFATRRGGASRLRLGPFLLELVKEWRPEVATLVDELISVARSDDGDVSSAVYEGMLRRIAAQRVGDDDAPLWRVVIDLAAGLRVTRVLQSGSTGNSQNLGYHVLLTAAGSTGPAFNSVTGEDDTESGSSVGRKQVALTSHQRAVASRARQFARNLGLSERTVESVAAAGLWHDEGKRDLRFQAMLRDGDMRRAELAVIPLAKSGMDPADRAAFRRAWQRSGYPRGMRHEALSALIAQRRISALPAVDLQLVVHLVASHHGRGRPLLPPVTDPAPLQVNIDEIGTFSTEETVNWTGPSRFADLNSTYGRWGLALLETIVRLADIWCSARDETEEES